MGDHEGKGCALKFSQSNPMRIHKWVSLLPPSQGILHAQESNSQIFCVLGRRRNSGRLGAVVGRKIIGDHGD